MSEQQDTNLYIDQDFSWDEPLVTDAGGGRTHFATLRLYSPSVIPFQAGQHFTISGVYDDKFDDSTKLTRREGQKQFNGMILGTTAKKHHYYVLVATKTDKNGGEYQVIKGFKSWQEKGRKNVWAELQFPALKGLDPAIRAKLQKGEAIYVSFEDTATGETYTPQGGDKTHDINYWSNFTVYPTQEALKEAEKVHFAQFGAQNGAAQDLSNFPANDWYSDDPKVLADNYKTLMEEIRAKGANASTFVKTAKDLSLVGPTGKVAKRVGSDEPVDLAALFAQALDVAQDEEITAAFAHLYKK